MNEWQVELSGGARVRAGLGAQESTRGGVVGGFFLWRFFVFVGVGPVGAGSRCRVGGQHTCPVPGIRCAVVVD